MANKDPAFLFYSKDWLQGTAGLMPDEKGVYIDLLAHQHQDGTIPNDPKRLARMVGLSQCDFDVIWGSLSKKFMTTEDNRLVNRKLIEIVTERSTKAHTKAILSRYAVLIKGIGRYPEPVIAFIKENFKVSDFEPFEKEQALIKLTEWFTERLTTALGNGNANTIGNQGKMDESKGGVGGEGEERKGSHTGIGPTMVSVFKEAFPEYPVDQVLDFGSCLQIAYKIADSKKWTKEQVVNGKQAEVVSIWRQMVGYIRGDKWFSTRSISAINKQFQDVMQAINNNGTHQQQPRKNSKSAGAIQLAEQLKAKLAARGNSNPSS